MITQDRLKELLHYNPDTGVFTNKKNRGGTALAGKTAGCMDVRGYFQIRASGTLHYSHRLAFLYMTGAFPVNHIDHINGEKADNRWVNIRSATPSENCRNAKKHKSNTSGIMGVRWNDATSSWRASMYLDGSFNHIGLFNSFFDACCARKSAEIRAGFHPNHGR